MFALVFREVVVAASGHWLFSEWSHAEGPMRESVAVMVAAAVISTLVARAKTAFTRRGTEPPIAQVTKVVIEVAPGECVKVEVGTHTAPSDAAPSVARKD